MRWTDAAVRAALSLPAGEGPGPVYAGIGTDTRGLTPGALFVALRGKRFDGHDHLEAARDAGAPGAVVRRGTQPVAGMVLYEVPDTLRAFGHLATYRRRRITGPVIAITGTNGKTSTREMIAALLRTRHPTWATRANLNNLIGVPLTILEAPAGTEALVVEAGASLPGEIARYREIIEPDVAVVTTVSHGHVEGFGSLDGILAEKLSLTAGAPVAIVGTHPPALAAGARTRAARVVTAGLADADVTPEEVSLTAEGLPRITVDGVTFLLGTPGLHQAGNAMCAWAVGRHLGVAPEEAGAALERLAIPGGRGEVQRHGALTILNDSYNANPQSFRSAIALAAAMRGGRRLVFVAGTMRELGDDEAALHAEIAAELRALRPEVLVGVGAFVRALEQLGPAPDGLDEVTAPDAAAAGPLVAERLRGDELIVLKASRGVALERILPGLVARADPSP